MKLSRFAILRAVAAFYIELFRNAPFLIVLYVIFYALPTLQVRLPPLVVGTGVLCLYATSYLAEIIRGAYLAVPRGQLEAARAVGMSHFQGIREIVAPQMVGFLIPPSTNMGIILIKETSVLALISVGELTYQGMVVQAATFAPFEVFVAVGGLYWLVCSVLSFAAATAERRSAHAIDGPRRQSVADSFLSRRTVAQVTDPVISARSLGKRFGAFMALDAIDLDVASGEIVALIGPSGCGKSTLLRCLAQLEVPDSGIVLLEGSRSERPPTGPAARAHERSTRMPRIGFVFQSLNLWPHMSALDTSPRR